MSAKPDLYVTVHKGQRARLFEIAQEAGSLSLADERSVEKLRDDLLAFRDHMFLHAKLEEENIHPLLAGKVPEGARELEEAHRVMHTRLDDLVACLEKPGSEPSERRERMLEFYRGWNRFISFYLSHIDKEEESVNPLLWKLCGVEELGAAFRNIVTKQTQEEVRYSLTMMMPAMNLDERAEMLVAGRGIMPAEAYQGFLGLTEKLLKPADWAALRGRLGG